MGISRARAAARASATAPGAAAPAAAALNPAARYLWRNPALLQVELGTRRTIVEGLDPPRLRALLAGTADAGTSHSVPPRTAAQLCAAGLLWTAPRADPDPRRVPPRAWLAPELTALTVRHGEQAAMKLADRARCVVAVHGHSRTAAHIAALLAASGVGRVVVNDSSAARLATAVPGGACPADEGRALAAVAADAVARAAPGTETSPLPFGERPDLVVLATDEPVEREQRDALHARECAHLLVQLGAGFGVVGPLVLPGLTSCLGCLDRHRLDRDPGWPALAVQLAQPPRAGTPAGAALATVVAGLAALQALAHLDGEGSAAIEGTLELHLPDWRLRRRSWPLHPSCGCVRA
jgi:hypothetical protein